MPFTAAHPMAVLPLVRWRRLDATCLVIGAMAPDFEYFVRLDSVAAVSHTLRGLWLWNLPVALVLAALAHGVVKWPLLLIAPDAIARRVIPIVRPWPARWNVAALASCAVSALLGAATHLAWDGLTHADGWMPRVVPMGRQPVTLPAIGTIVVHRLLQHASSVVGLLVLTAVIARRVARLAPAAIPAVPRTAARWWFAACTSAGVALTMVRITATPAVDVGRVVVGAIAGTLAGTILASASLYRAGRRLAGQCAPTNPRAHNTKR
jgi:hypothetical protein